MIEDRTHRSVKLNPRKHSTGAVDYPNTSKDRFWDEPSFQKIALVSVGEIKFMQEVPKLLGDGNYANLGHSRGRSAIILAKGIQEWCDTGLVYSVDVEWAKRSLDLMHQHDVRDVIKKCRCSTNRASKNLSKVSFNFVFIDADHCYDAVVADFSDWSPLVRVGGWVCFHDTNQDFSHKAIETVMTDNDEWVERTEYHIDRIRTFERVK